LAESVQRGNTSELLIQSRQESGVKWTTEKGKKQWGMSSPIPQRENKESGNRKTTSWGKTFRRGRGGKRAFGGANSNAREAPEIAGRVAGKRGPAYGSTEPKARSVVREGKKKKGQTRSDLCETRTEKKRRGRPDSGRTAAVAIWQGEGSGGENKMGDRGNSETGLFAPVVGRGGGPLKKENGPENMDRVQKTQRNS